MKDLGCPNRVAISIGEPLVPAKFIERWDSGAVLPDSDGSALAATISLGCSPRCGQRQKAYGEFIRSFVEKRARGGSLGSKCGFPHSATL